MKDQLELYKEIDKSAHLKQQKDDIHKKANLMLSNIAKADEVSSQKQQLSELEKEKQYQESILLKIRQMLKKFDLKTSYGKVTPAIEMLKNIPEEELLSTDVLETIGDDLDYEAKLNLLSDINIQDHYGRTPIMYAFQNKNMKMVELCIQKGAKFDYKDIFGNTVLDYAALFPHIGYTTQVIRASKKEALCNKGKTRNTLAQAIVLNSSKILFLDEINSKDYHSGAFHIGGMSGDGYITIDGNNLTMHGACTTLGGISMGGGNNAYNTYEVKALSLLQELYAKDPDSFKYEDENGQNLLLFSVAMQANYVVKKLFTEYPEKSWGSKGLVLASVITQNLSMVKKAFEAAPNTDLEEAINSQNNYKGLTALHLAACYDADDIIDYLISLGAEVKTKSASGMYAIHNAAYNGASGALYTLAQHCDINMVSDEKNGYTPLLYACAMGQINAVKKIVALGGDKNYISPNGYDALQVCLDSKNLEFFKQAKAFLNPNLEHRDNQGLTVLDWAVIYNMYNFVEYLLLQGANPKTSNHKGLYLIHNLAANGLTDSMELVKPYYSDIDIKTDNADGYTAFLYACWYGQQNTAEKLKTWGADIHATSSNGINGLCLITDRHSRDSDMTEFIKLMISWGMDINNFRLDNKINFFAFSCIKGMKEIAHIVMHKQDFDASVIDSLHSYNSLMRSMLLKDEDFTMEFLSKFIEQIGGGINHQDKWGQTMLYKAVVANMEKLIKVLLEDHNADPNISTKNQVTPLYASLGYHMQAIDVRIIDLLLQHNADVSKAMEDGDSPMHMVAYKGYKELVEKFKAKGANVNQQNQKGETPIISAVINPSKTEIAKQKNVIAELITQGGDTSIKDNNGHDALFYVQQHIDNQELEYQDLILLLGHDNTSNYGDSDF